MKKKIAAGEKKRRSTVVNVWDEDEWNRKKQSKVIDGKKSNRIDEQKQIVVDKKKRVSTVVNEWHSDPMWSMNNNKIVGDEQTRGRSTEVNGWDEGAWRWTNLQATRQSKRCNQLPAERKQMKTSMPRHPSLFIELNTGTDRCCVQT